MIETFFFLSSIYLTFALIDEFIIDVPSYAFVAFGIIMLYFGLIMPICHFIGEPMAKRAKEKAEKNYLKKKQ